MGLRRSSEWLEKDKDLRRRLALSCSNVVRLDLDWQCFRSLASYSYSVRKENLLSKLKVQGLLIDENIPDRDLQPSRTIYDIVLPNVRKLVLSGEFYNQVMNMFLKICPSLAEVELDHKRDWTEWNPAGMPADFVSKIKAWKFHDIERVCLVMDMFPSFAPEIPFHFNDERQPIDPEQWRKLCRLPSLKQVSLSGIKTQALLLGVPRNIKKLKIGELVPTFYELGPLAPTDDHQAQLLAVLQDLRSRNMNVDFHYCVDRTFDFCW